ncbi:uncharacterized protein A4U43_C03F30890 [Asparagus officinalis]|uniref:DRBM domain-containing protein n=1 Tax=Asparagus officinalis TaxID=4686 RepID=A0A5P1FGY9_ASPOF|nr:ribonuclease 3-like protein 1 [Asparagus officinalis]ONK76677.1 uncharacterized protein A4U43_C03F30890 [Asparagus officinalis]
MFGSEVDPLHPVTRWWVDAAGTARVWADPMVNEALVFIHKRTTLQEPVQSTQKESAELIVYNEQPITALNNNFLPKYLSQEPERTPSKSLQDQEVTCSKFRIQEKMETSPTAKMRLYEICVAKHWKRPSFVLCKEEGPNDRKMFTFRVIVHIEGISSTLLECYSEPKQQKRAAQENAAEGALWYLKHLGYLSKP